jgi:hypothetical protein
MPRSPVAHPGDVNDPKRSQQQSATLPTGIVRFGWLLPCREAAGMPSPVVGSLRARRQLDGLLARNTLDLEHDAVPIDLVPDKARSGRF